MTFQKLSAALLAAACIAAPASANDEHEHGDAAVAQAIIRDIQANDNAYITAHNAAFFQELAKGQHPRATVVTCSDSRVHSNNMYLEVLTGGGLAGGLAFAWLCWRAARRAVHPVLRPSDPAVASLAAAVCAAAVAIALHGLVDSFLGFTGTYIPIAIVLGLAVAGDAINGTRADAHRL